MGIMERRSSGGREMNGEAVIEGVDPEGDDEACGEGFGGTSARLELRCWSGRNVQWSHGGTSFLMGRRKEWVVVVSSAASIGDIGKIGSPGCYVL